MIFIESIDFNSLLNLSYISSIDRLIDLMSSSLLIPPWITLSFSVLLFTCVISYTLFCNYSSSSPYTKEIYNGGLECSGDPQDECENAMLNLLLYVLKENNVQKPPSSALSHDNSQYHYKNIRRGATTTTIEDNDTSTSRYSKKQLTSSPSSHKKRSGSKRVRNREEAIEDEEEEEEEEEDMDYIYTSTSHDYKLQKQRHLVQGLTLL